MTVEVPRRHWHGLPDDALRAARAECVAKAPAMLDSLDPKISHLGGELLVIAEDIDNELRRRQVWRDRFEQ